MKWYQILPWVKKATKDYKDKKINTKEYLKILKEIKKLTYLKK